MIEPAQMLLITPGPRGNFRPLKRSHHGSGSSPD
jgi:hypothetical protein